MITSFFCDDIQMHRVHWWKGGTYFSETRFSLREAQELSNLVRCQEFVDA